MDLLESEIFSDLFIPLVSLIHLGVSEEEEIQVIFDDLFFPVAIQFHFVNLCLSLLVTRNISIVAKVKALFLENGLHAIYISDSLNGQLPVVRKV